MGPHVGARRWRAIRRAVARRTALVLAVASGNATAMDSPARGACPDADDVWSSVRALVPSAADRWSAARPRVEIVDEGERYRVRVATPSGRVLERVYSDAARDCATRTRFAAEFIVVALMPPMIGDVAGPAGGTSSASAPAANAPSEDATQAPAPAPSASSASATAPPAALRPPGAAPSTASAIANRDGVQATRPRARWRWLRIELEALGEAAPKVFGASSVLTTGPEIRASFGRGAWSAFGSVAYEPPVGMTPDSVLVRLMRVPIAAGARLQRRFGAFEVAGDFGAALAIEAYDAPELHQGNEVVHVAPGLQAGAGASWEAAGIFGFVVGIRCTWLPAAQELVSAPAGDLGKTPSLWLGAVIGVSLEP